MVHLRTVDIANRTVIPVQLNPSNNMLFGSSALVP